jgi:serine/threonine protein kinase
MHELHVLRLAWQVADGFDQAWTRAEVIHRDLKPGSILVDLLAMRDKNGELVVKVTDFGHALGKRLVDQFEHELAIEEEDFRRVARTERVGSPICMSPEQFQGKELGPSSDMYALGVTMFLLLAGRTPFTGTDVELQHHHTNTRPPELPSDISAPTSALVRRLLAKLPDGRFDSWAQLRNQISGLVKRQEPRPSRRTTTEGPSTTEIRYRKTTGRFDRSPVGQAIPNKLIEAPTQLGTPSQASMESLSRMLNHLALIQPPGAVSALMPMAGPVRVAPAIPAADSGIAAQVPTADSGQRSQQQVVTLSNEQLNTLWSYLFNRIEAPPAGPTVTPPAGVPQLQQHRTPVPFRTSTPLPSPGYTPNPEPAQAQAISAVKGSERQLPVVAPATAPVDADATTSAAATRLSPDEPEAPVEVPWSARQAVIDALAVLVLHASHTGSPPGAESITRRFTRRIKRMLGDRTSISLAIDRALCDGNFDEASRLLDGLAETGGNDGPICIQRARLAGLLHDYEQMIDWAQHAIIQKIDDPIALAAIAFANICLGKDYIAHVISSNLAEAHPDSPLGALCLAGVTIIAGKTEDSALHLNAAAEIDPENPALTLITEVWWRITNDAPEKAELA